MFSFGHLDGSIHFPLLVDLRPLNLNPQSLKSINIHLTVLKGVDDVEFTQAKNFQRLKNTT